MSFRYSSLIPRPNPWPQPLASVLGLSPQPQPLASVLGLSPRPNPLPQPSASALGLLPGLRPPRSLADLEVAGVAELLGVPPVDGQVPLLQGLIESLSSNNLL